KKKPQGIRRIPNPQFWDFIHAFISVVKLNAGYEPAALDDFLFNLCVGYSGESHLLQATFEYLLKDCLDNGDFCDDATFVK
ncbi:tRNA wybutosine-synthesizing protein 4, partial [Frankliniella fusca]